MGLKGPVHQRSTPREYCLVIVIQKIKERGKREREEGEGRREERTNREGGEKGERESGKNKNKPTFYVHLTAIIIFQLNEW